jgi:hypothetical protein
VKVNGKDLRVGDAILNDGVFQCYLEVKLNEYPTGNYLMRQPCSYWCWSTRNDQGEGYLPWTSEYEVMRKEEKSVFLENLHHACAQTDGTYAFPNSREGDMLKQAKVEIEALSLKC